MKEDELIEKLDRIAASMLQTMGAHMALAKEEAWGTEQATAAVILAVRSEEPDPMKRMTLLVNAATMFGMVILMGAMNNDKDAAVAYVMVRSPTENVVLSLAERPLASDVSSDFDYCFDFDLIETAIAGALVKRWEEALVDMEALKLVKVH